ncbi:hypothetical protein JTE90_003238 [Oedothorax gibbosus]|uniref:Uncharacterized protein n=1 Tax=Oedothorax gibbosus TaxID=931172 RepID=A0AAV6UNG3_9ARAC|nr:hypothetical protein JTE90_003238 [Oedothorax gibbosus]
MGPKTLAHAGAYAGSHLPNAEELNDLLKNPMGEWVFAQEENLWDPIGTRDSQEPMPFCFANRRPATYDSSRGLLSIWH